MREISHWEKNYHTKGTTDLPLIKGHLSIKMFNNSNCQDQRKKIPKFCVDEKGKVFLSSTHWF